MAFERNVTNARVVQDLKKRSTIGIIFYVLLAFIVVFAEGFYFRKPSFSLIFLLSITGICLFRLIHLVISRKMAERYEILNRYIFFTSVIITGLVWGLTLSLLMLHEGEPGTQLIMTVCISGLCAGGVVAFIPHRMLSIIFNISMLVPTTIILLAKGFNIPLAVMFFLYSVYLVLIAIRGNAEYWDALENENLLEIKSLELARLSNTDVLTGLYNRRFFNDAFDKEWKRSGRDNRLLSIILFDIDYFKKINDTFGHQVGDAYLKKTAEVLTSVFKRESDIVARYGGEEFIILLPGTGADHALQLAEKATQSMASLAIDYQGEKVGTTLSAGVNCCIPNFNVRPDSMIVGADQALYMAKERGRNQVVVLPESIYSN
jgi:diguanylate cyclase (GGDEF)-like protein